MTDLRKASLDLLYDLIEESNPGFKAKFPKGSIKFSGLTSTTVGGGFTNTRITFRPTLGSTAIGSGYLFYRRLDLAKLFKNMSLTINTWRNATSIANTEFIPLVNQKYGLNLELSDIRQSGWPADGAGYLQAADASLCYTGIANITWVKGKRPLSDLVTADKRTFDGRSFPGSITTYAQFQTWLTATYGNSSSTTAGALANSSTNAIGSSYTCVDSALPVFGDPVGDFARYDSGMAGVIRMLMGNKAVADDNFTNGRRIGFTYGASTARSSFPAATRNGVTSQSAGSGTGIPILALYWWDEINKRPMRWQNPNTQGTVAVPFASRVPVAEERPRGELIGYGFDYSKWSAKLASTVSWQELADMVKEATGLPITADLYSTKYGIQVPTANFVRYTLPSASVPQANSAKFNRVIAITSPDMGCWFAGTLYIHYNV